MGTFRFGSRLPSTVRWDTIRDEMECIIQIRKYVLEIKLSEIYGVLCQMRAQCEIFELFEPVIQRSHQAFTAVFSVILSAVLYVTVAFTCHVSLPLVAQCTSPLTQLFHLENLKTD
jgi:hypothetical protein